MSPWIAAAIGASVGFVVAWVWQARAKAELPDIEKIHIEPGDTILVRYKGFLTGDQRRQLQHVMELRFKGQARKVIVLEAGIELEVRKEESRLMSEKLSIQRYNVDPDGEEFPDEKGFYVRYDDLPTMRRRDDNRAQRAPEEPWQ
jgi:hypothetical protein